MTSVLLLLYLADLAVGVSVICLLAGIVMLVVWCVRWLVNFDKEYGDGAVMRSMPNKRFLWFVIMLFSITAIMPSKTTLYAVAAVQAGDALADSERGAKVLNALDRWLDQQVKSED